MNVPGVRGVFKIVALGIVARMSLKKYHTIVFFIKCISVLDTEFILAKSLLKTQKVRNFSQFNYIFT